MSNGVYIETVHLRYLSKEPTDNRDRYGFYVWDYFEHFHLLDFNTEVDIPGTLEAILEYCLKAGYSQVWDLILRNIADELCVVLDEDYFEFEEVKRLIKAVKKRHKETYATTNCLYVESVEVDYFHKSYPGSRKLYGFIVRDDYDRCEILDYSSEAGIPDTLEKVLRQCNNGENDMAFDLFNQHATADKGVVFDGNFIDSVELKRLLDLLDTEDESKSE